jgi:hypothetical protein
MGKVKLERCFRAENRAKTACFAHIAVRSPGRIYRMAQMLGCLGRLRPPGAYELLLGANIEVRACLPPRDMLKYRLVYGVVQG